MMSRGRSLALLVAPLATLLGACAGSTSHQYHYGLSHYDMGLIDNAVGPLQVVARRLDDTVPTDPRLPRVLDALGHIAQERGAPELAERYFRFEIERCAGLNPPNAMTTQNALTSLGLFLRAHDRHEEAVRTLEQARDLAESERDDRRGLSIALDNLALGYASAGRFADAMAANSRALEVLDALPTDEPNTRTRSVVLYNRAGHLAEHGDAEQADTTYREAIATYDRSRGDGEEDWRLRVMLRNYGRFLRDQHRDADAEAIEARSLTLY